ncbi:MAG: VOC family protein [Ignavibacteriae bacterium]|nr:VOC family protein [Ignavibacteriota bacterium]
MFNRPFPMLYVKDIEHSVKFYCDNFNFVLSYLWPQQGSLEYAFLRLSEYGIGIATRGATKSLLGKPLPRQGTPQFELCLFVDDTDEASEHLRSKGVKRLVLPMDKPWGERLAYFEDPNGNPIQITAKIT